MKLTAVPNTFIPYLYKYFKAHFGVSPFLAGPLAKSSRNVCAGTNKNWTGGMEWNNKQTSNDFSFLNGRWNSAKCRNGGNPLDLFKVFL